MSSKIKGLLHFLSDPRLLLALVAQAYIIYHMQHGAAPGNNPAHPEGWWGWFDQGNYLTAAYAFAAFNFSFEQHFYPPLYPLLGAVFSRINGTHPYWLVNLLCLLWFTWVFIHFARRYVPQWLSILLFAGTVLANGTLFEEFVIPWTTTLSAALLSTGIHSLGRNAIKYDTANTKQRNTRKLVICSLAVGLMAATRPPDVLVGGLIWLGVIGGARTGSINAGLPFGRQLAISLAAISVGPLLFLSFNLWVFGSPIGGYIQTNSGNGYFPDDMGEKFVSLFLDSQTLYLEPNSGLLNHYPWLILAPPSLLFVLIRGDMILRVVAAAICLQFALYIPYGDLLPNGLWRYHNIHYFKWTFPYLGLLICHAGLTIVNGLTVRTRESAMWASMFVAAVLLLAFLRLDVVLHSLPPKALTHSSHNEIAIDTGPDGIDLLDITGLHGSFAEIYFGKHRLTLDGIELRSVKNYRVLPAPWGVRVLFIRTVKGKSIVYQPDPRITVAADELDIRKGSYQFTLGRSANNAIPAAPYRLGDRIDFSTTGKGNNYIREGWSAPEPWGRWATAPRAELSFRLPPQVAKVNVEMSLLAFVNVLHPQQRINIKANGHLVKELVFNAVAGGNTPRSESFTVTLASDNVLTLSLEIPDAASPANLGLSGDTRTLGAGLVSLSITAE